MPSFSTYKNLVGASLTNGDVRKSESDMVMEATWDNDLSSQTAYFYDCYHDNEPLALRGLNPQDDKNKIPIRIKFLQYSSQTYEKDYVSFHIQFMPSFHYEDLVYYYDEYFKDRYDAIFPVGLYIDIKDESGNYNKWLVVGTANFYTTQFPTYEILPCNYILQYIYNSVKYQFAVTLRSQNSYNSGLWTDNKFETTEDQQKFVIPLNRDTEHIFYNQRMIIDAKVETEPRAWKVSKINRTSPRGIIVTTLAQDHFDQNKDYIERNTDGKITGMWADYYTAGVTPIEKSDVTNSDSIYSKVTYAGTAKIYCDREKIFKVNFYNQTDEISIMSGQWSITSEKIYTDNTGSSHTVDEYITTVISDDLSNIAITFPKTDEIGVWIGETITIAYATDDGTIVSSAEVVLKG